MDTRPSAHPPEDGPSDHGAAHRSTSARPGAPAFDDLSCRLSGDEGEQNVFDNAAWAAARSKLSVLIPFHRDDPRPLLAALTREAAGLYGAVEIVVLDDCGGDRAVSDGVLRAIRASETPGRLIRPSRNTGRAKGRNRLMACSRGHHCLFLDSDMLPGSPRFLAAYLALLDTDPAVVFGGFSVERAPTRPEYALHHALALRGECLSAAVRSRTPAKYVYTSNLMVRRDVFEAEGFDEAFNGWGWEDVEWGLRVGRNLDVVHIDNPATHLGLDTAAALAAKYEQSPANFARVLARHPDAVKTYPSYRLARMLRRAPGRAVWRPGLKALALTERAPIAVRVAAMKLFRAALYAEVV